MECVQDINIKEYIKNPLTCDCSHSPFQYNPSGHVITGDLNINQHESLRKVISHGPKFIKLLVIETMAQNLLC